MGAYSTVTSTETMHGVMEVLYTCVCACVCMFNLTTTDNMVCYVCECLHVHVCMCICVRASMCTCVRASGTLAGCRVRTRVWLVAVGKKGRGRGCPILVKDGGSDGDNLVKGTQAISTQSYQLDHCLDHCTAQQQQEGAGLSQLVRHQAALLNKCLPLDWREAEETSPNGSLRMTDRWAATIWQVECSEPRYGSDGVRASFPPLLFSFPLFSPLPLPAPDASTWRQVLSRPVLEVTRHAHGSQLGPLSLSLSLSLFLSLAFFRYVFFSTTYWPRCLLCSVVVFVLLQIGCLD